MDFLRIKLIDREEINILSLLKTCSKGAFNVENNEVVILLTIEYNDINNFIRQMLTISL